MSLDLPSEDFDTAGMHNPADTHVLTAPIDGIYQITASVEWQANTSGRRAAGRVRTARDEGVLR